MKANETSGLEGGVKTLAEYTGAAVGAVLGWQVAAPEVGVLWSFVSATVGAIIGKKVTEGVVR